MAKINRLVNWFWNSFVKGNDDKRIEAQREPDFDDAVLDIDYAGDGHKLHTLNVYRPKNCSDVLPVIFDIHGGGWYYGDKELNAYFCRSLVREGFAVVDVSYRVAPEADIFDQIHDVCLAMDFVLDHSDEYGLDAENFFAVGDSAGGHICALVSNIATDPALKDRFGVTPRITPRASALICPALEPLDIAPLPKRCMKFYFEPVFGKDYLKNDVRSLISFKNVLNKDMCPTVFISAKGDFLKKQTREGYQLAISKGVPAEFVFLNKPTDPKHKLAHVFNVLNWDWQESEYVNKAMCDFFKKHAKL